MEIADKIFLVFLADCISLPRKKGVPWELVHSRYFSASQDIQAEQIYASPSACDLGGRTTTQW
jgi:hypothetical protein